MTVNDSEEMIKARILKVLEIYPRISPSMLQIGIGPSYKSRIWRPVLDKLIAEGKVVHEDLVAFTSTDREQVYRIVSLAPHKDEVGV